MATVPTAPQVFRQPLASDQTLEFSWQGPLSDGGSAITGYRITITPVGGSPIVHTISDPAAIYWKETGLTNNTWYEITLEAENAIGYSEPAFFRSFQPGSKPEYPPASAVATIAGSSSVLVSWTAPSILPDATIYWYSIYARSSNPADPEISAGGDGQTETSLLIEGLNPASSYYFEVYAVNCPGYSPVAITGTINFNLNNLTASWAMNIFNQEASAATDGKTVAVDGSGNMYVAGSMTLNGTLYIQNLFSAEVSCSAVTLQGTGGKSVFLVKYDTSGIVQWATSFEGDGSFAAITKVVVDASNNPCLTGYYMNSTTVTLKDASGNGQVASSIILPSTNQFATFIMKYDANGIVQWATYFDGSGFENTGSLAVDVSNNIYIVGIYDSSSSVTLQDASGNGQVASAVTLPITTSNGVYLVKYDSNGVTQWATYLDGTSNEAGSDIVLDGSNNIFITGSYNSSSSVTLQDASGNGQVASAVTLPSTTDDAAFLVKYDSNGVTQWATYLDGDAGDSGYGITLDASDNIYVTGSYTSSSSVTLQDASGNGQVASAVTLPITTLTAAFLVKYDASGIVQWATFLDGDDNDTAFSVVTDSTNNVYITGRYSSTVDVTLQDASGNGQTASAVTLPISNNNAVFLVKYDASGVTQWATYYDGDGQEYGGYAITKDTSDNIYVAGNYTSSSYVYLNDADGNTQVESAFYFLPSYNATTGCVMKYDTTGFAQMCGPVGLSGRIEGVAVSNFGDSFAKDSAGNIYMLGSFGTITPNNFIHDISGAGQTNSSITLPNTNDTFNALLIKYDTSGIAQWAINLEWNSNINYAVTDGSNNVYIIGNYSSPASIYVQNASGSGQTPSSITLPLGNNTFIIKYNSSGIAQWATNIPRGTGAGVGLALDVSNNVYASGYYNSGASVTIRDASGNGQAASTITLPSTTGTDGYLVKYDSNGIAQWATNIKGTGTDQARKVQIDALNNVYLFGRYTSASIVTLNDASGNSQTPSSVTLPITSGNDVFLIQYNTNGIVQWAINLQGTGTDNGVVIKFDTSNNIYITGFYRSSATVTLQDASGNGQAASAFTLPSTGVNDYCYLIKYNSSGIAQWGTYAAATSIAGYGLVLDAFNNIYVYGYYSTNSSIILQDVSGNSQSASTYTIPTTGGNINQMLIKYSSDGIVKYGTVFVPDSGTVLVSTQGLGVGIADTSLYIVGAYASSGGVTFVEDVADGVVSQSTVSLPISGTSTTAESLGNSYLVKFAL